MSPSLSFGGRLDRMVYIIHCFIIKFDFPHLTNGPTEKTTIGADQTPRISIPRKNFPLTLYCLFQKLCQPTPENFKRRGPTTASSFPFPKTPHLETSPFGQQLSDCHEFVTSPEGPRELTPHTTCLGP